MSIDTLLDAVMKREGKTYENVKHDNGGPTKFGITIHDLRRWRKSPRLTWQAVRDLTEEEAREIYKARYWTGPGFDLLPELIQESMLDFGILHGPPRAVRALQEIINEAGFGPVDTDGKLGPQTFRCAVDACREMGEYLVNAIVEERSQHFSAIVASNPSQQKFFRGWMNRINPFRKKIDLNEYA